VGPLLHGVFPIGSKRLWRVSTADRGLGLAADFFCAAPTLALENPSDKGGAAIRSAEPTHRQNRFRTSPFVIMRRRASLVQNVRKRFTLAVHRKFLLLKLADEVRMCISCKTSNSASVLS